MLRHDVLNAATIVRGYANGAVTEQEEAKATIQGAADRIEQTVEEVNELADDSSIDRHAIAIPALIERIIAPYPDAWIETDIEDVAAAGIIMPVWLQATGVDTSVPNLTVDGFLSHVLWGGLLGVTYTLLER